MTSHPSTPADIGVIGLAVMGANLALNLESRGFTVAVYNRTAAATRAFMAAQAPGRRLVATDAPAALVAALAPPRKILLMVKAGEAVDQLIAQLIPLLDPGDILIDGGNAHYAATERRTALAEARGLLYVGTGVSGGEEGALHGPSLMPGGSPAAWPHVRPLLEAVAARAPDGTPCCAWIGRGGAGHFVKMVHNGIEYGDMQLIAEAYHVLRDVLGLGGEMMQQVFARWNAGDLQSYLIEITAAILAVREADGELLLERILDAAGQKGTGRWTAAAALEMGVPLTLIAESVFARALSAQKEARQAAAAILPGPPSRPSITDTPAQIADLAQALLAAKIISYAQGFALLKAASAQYAWELDAAQVALVWRSGCIIRSGFLEPIAQAFRESPDLANLVLAPYFKEKLRAAQGAWRNVAALALRYGIPIPALTGALTYYDGLRCARLPANLIQAQRDYFGAHTYERVDRSRGEFFHTDWLAASTHPGRGKDAKHD